MRKLLVRVDSVCLLVGNRLVFAYKQIIEEQLQFIGILFTIVDSEAITDSRVPIFDSVVRMLDIIFKVFNSFKFLRFESHIWEEYSVRISRYSPQFLDRILISFGFFLRSGLFLGDLQFGLSLSFGFFD